MSDRQPEPPPISAERARRWVVLGIAAYAVAFSVYSLLRYYSFRTLYYDLGIFSYSMSQVLHGAQGLPTLLFPSTPGHIGHFSPILVLPLALYAILPSPATLLVFQSLLLALAALPLFELALEVLHRRDLAVAIAFTYLLYPALQGVNRYDFHVEAFVPLLAFAAGLALVRGHFRSFLVAALLLLCTHEYLSIVFLWTGGVVLVYQLVAHKAAVLGAVTRRWSATAAVLGAAFLALEEALNVLLTPTHASVFAWLSTTTSTYTGGPLALLAGAGVDPELKILYWLLLLVPLLLLPVRELRMLLPAVPWLGLTLLASNRGIYSVYSQYSALVLPFLFFAAVFAMRRPFPIPRLKISGRRWAAALVAVGLVATATIGPLSPLNAYDGAFSNGAAPPYPPAVTAQDQGTARILGLIPTDATVLAQNELFSQVSDRAEAAPYWNGSSAGPPQYLAVDAGLTWFANVLPPYPTSLSDQVAGLLRNDTYTVAGFAGASAVYRLRGPAVPSLSEEAAPLPDSAGALAANWTADNGTASWSPAGMDLVPTGGLIASLTRAVASPSASLLVAANLTWSNASGPVSWSGLVFGSSGPTSPQILFLLPALGQLWYGVLRGGLPVARPVANVTVRGTSASLAVLAGAGLLQVSVDGRGAVLLSGLPAPVWSRVGVLSLNQDLRVSSFSTFRSTADAVPLADAIPWDGLAAGVGMIVPVIAVLLVEPDPGRLVRRCAAALRRAAGRGR